MRLGPHRILEPFRVLGQTALFYYLLHIHLMKLVAVTFGIEHAFGVGSAWIGGVAVAVILYPLCVRYRRFKQAHPNSVARFV
jgi:predicted acyltransferase